MKSVLLALDCFMRELASTCFIDWHYGIIKKMTPQKKMTSDTHHVEQRQ